MLVPAVQFQRHHAQQDEFGSAYRATGILCKRDVDADMVKLIRICSSALDRGITRCLGNRAGIVLSVLDFLALSAAWISITIMHAWSFAVFCVTAATVLYPLGWIVHGYGEPQTTSTVNRSTFQKENPRNNG